MVVILTLIVLMVVGIWGETQTTNQLTNQLNYPNQPTVFFPIRNLHIINQPTNQPTPRCQAATAWPGSEASTKVMFTRSVTEHLASATVPPKRPKVSKRWRSENVRPGGIGDGDFGDLLLRYFLVDVFFQKKWWKEEKVGELVSWGCVWLWGVGWLVGWLCWSWLARPLVLGDLGPFERVGGSSHHSSSWWFQPIRKILVKLDHFPK